MKKIVFTEAYCQPQNLFPFTLTRQIQDLRVGILTIREKWERHLDCPSFDKDEGDYKDIDAVRLDNLAGGGKIFLIHGNALPTTALAEAVKALKGGQSLSVPEQEHFVYCISKKQVDGGEKIRIDEAIPFTGKLQELRRPWDLCRLNAWAIVQDFELVTRKRKTAALPKWVQAINKKDIFIETGAVVETAVLNASEGPIYIGKDAVVMDGAILRGPVAVCEGAVVKMGARLYGGTTIGPYSVAGGEIKNSILTEYSNKAHDGYLGDAVLGAWCNLGAGTSNSNLKNSAGDVEVYLPGGPQNAGLKCGVFMGDYSRTAINTSINTGTVIGVCCNVFGSGLTPKFISNFSWGAEGVERYRLELAIKHINNWMNLKGHEFSDRDKAILHHIYNNY